MDHHIINGKEHASVILENVSARANALEEAGWLTPVPGRAGPVTVAMLLQNTIVAVERQKQRYEETMRA